MINEKTQLKIKYLKMKKSLEKYNEEKKFEKHKQLKLLNVLIESIRNI